MLIVLSIWLFPLSAKSQVADIQVSSGTVQFIFATLDQYKNGIDLVPKTQIKIKLQSQTGKPFWKLSAYALDDAIYNVEGGGTFIPLTDLELTVSATGDYTVGGFIFPLTETPQEMLGSTGGDGPALYEVTVTISYKLPSMLDKPGGTYFVGIYFELWNHNVDWTI